MIKTSSTESCISSTDITPFFIFGPKFDVTLNAIKESFPDVLLICILGIWGRLNARPVDELSQVLTQADAVFFSPLGDCAISRGGAELDNVVTLIKEKMRCSQTSVYDDIKPEQILKVLGKFNIEYPTRKKVVITLGYDKYNEDFCNILNMIEGLEEYK